MSWKCCSPRSMVKVTSVGLSPWIPATQSSCSGSESSQASPAPNRGVLHQLLPGYCRSAVRWRTSSLIGPCRLARWICASTPRWPDLPQSLRSALVVNIWLLVSDDWRFQTHMIPAGQQQRFRWKIQSWTVLPPPTGPVLRPLCRTRRMVLPYATYISSRCDDPSFESFTSVICTAGCVFSWSKNYRYK